MDSPITTEREALIAECERLAAENRRLEQHVLALGRAPAYPEEAVRAVWWHGATLEGRDPLVYWMHNSEEIGRIFIAKLQKGKPAS